MIGHVVQLIEKHVKSAQEEVLGDTRRTEAVEVSLKLRSVKATGGPESPGRTGGGH